MALFQVGPLDAKAKARKTVVRREKQQLAELTRPDEVQVRLIGPAPSALANSCLQCAPRALALTSKDPF